MILAIHLVIICCTNSQEYNTKIFCEDIYLDQFEY